MNIAVPIEFEPAPVEIDPRPCELCGLTIDRHVEIDNGEGPEFFCADISPDDMTLDELERRAELRRQEEVAAIIAGWEEDDAGRPRPAPPPPKDEYRTPQSTIDAFRHVVALNDLERLKAWLADRSKDAPFLLDLLENKR
jgi:hypothetical protein